MKFKGISIKYILPVVIVIAAFLFMRFLASFRLPPPKEIRIDLGVMVDVMEVQKETRRVRIFGTGTVQPEKEIELIPEVSGKVIKISDAFKAGGFFRKGETFLEIDPRDYELLVEQSKATVSKAEVELQTVEGRARVARKEWERSAPPSTRLPNPLVLYEPQLKEARTALDSAKAALGQALINLERTKLKAPFDCVIRSETIDLGQYVKAGTGIGMATGTEKMEVVVPLTLKEMSLLYIPFEPERKGSEAVVSLKGGERGWKGYVSRALPDVDPKGRMARVVVQVEKPFIHDASEKELEKYAMNLMPGMFVEVAFWGKEMRNVFSLPSRAIREDSTVWIMDREEKLEIRKVKIVHKERDTVLVSQGLRDGELVVLTEISGASQGMKLRRLKEN